MKYLPLALLLILIACSQKQKHKYHQIIPKRVSDTLFVAHAVHNSCTGKWAMETGIDSIYKWVYDKGDTSWQVIYFLGKDNTGGLFPTFDKNGEQDGYEWHVMGDTIDNATAGDELQFSDSLTTATTYKVYRYNIDAKVEQAAQAERNKKRDKFVADSIFKCSHTYNP